MRNLLQSLSLQNLGLRSLGDFVRANGANGNWPPGLRAAGLGAEAFAEIIELSQDAVLIAGRLGEVVYANQAYRELFALQAAEFPLPGVLSTLRCDEAQADRLYRLQKAAGEGLGAAEALVIDGPLGQQSFEVQVMPLRSGEGLSLWTLRRRDITQIKPAPAAKASIRDHLLETVTNAPFGIVIARGDGTMILANALFARWLGVDAENLVGGGRKFFDFAEWPGSPWARGADDLAPVSGALAGAERAIILGADGARIPVSVLYFIQPGDNAGAREVQFIMRDLRDADAIDLTALGGMEAHFLRLFDIAPVGIAIVDPQARIVETNAAFQRNYGGPSARGDSFLELVAPDYRGDVTRHIAGILQHDAQPGHIDIQLGGGDSARAVQLFATHMHEHGAASSVLYLVDVTEQRNLELQFAQSQKMQAVGQLAGGIAHDFNNLLTAILGYSDLLLSRHAAGDPSFSDIHQIKQNASRAANLVRQLLAFSRQQTLRPKVISLTDMLAELNNLLRRLLGDSIELTLTHGRNLGAIKVDQGQLENVIINLAINARDAMGAKGGKLAIRTANISAGEARQLDHAWMPNGDCVMIEVADTGPGIAKEIAGKIFEPFFTTKEVGKGTGLGLSMAYGIVKQQGGNIYVSSEPGDGAVFRIYLPLYYGEETENVAGPALDSERADLTGQGTILLVEDEDPVRTFAARALTGKGYTVLEANSGEMALQLVRQHRGNIDLLVSDVMMPNMDGATLLKQIRDICPLIRCIFISGYAEDAFRDNDAPLGDFAFLPKPFTLKQLAARVKEVISEPGVSSGF